MQLIVSEKPSVAASIAKVLGAKSRKDGYIEGSGWLVSWCVGHLVELAPADAYDPRYSKWVKEDLPIVPQEWKYIVLPNTKKQFNVLSALMADDRVDGIVCATDAGCEGELIFRFVYNLCGCHKPVKRLWISSMEESAIRRGFDTLLDGKNYDALYQAALCRSKADWLIGINATRLFTTVYGGRTLNVGRVVTPTLALLVEREAVISGFRKEKFYSVELDLHNFEVISERFTSKTDAEKLRAACLGKNAVVRSVEELQKTERPPKLYDLTTLQREANRLFGYTAQQTLDYVQMLYEKRLTTYPRTDSRYLTNDMESGLPDLCCTVAEALPFAGQPATVNAGLVVNSGKVSDHHALIPTPEIGGADLASLPTGERNILYMIAARLLCAVGEDHTYSETAVTLECGGALFSAKGRTEIAEGWKATERAFHAALGKKAAEVPAALPALSEGEVIHDADAAVKEGVTNPPARYTEDTLLSAMERAGAEDFANIEGIERAGLGTPATRAGIIEKLIKSGFVERNKKQLIPTEKGVDLIRVMPDVLKSAKLTAEWEEKLSEVQRGTLTPADFLAGITDMLEGLVKTYQGVAVASTVLSQSGRAVVGTCPRCGKKVVEGQKSFFCEGYYDKGIKLRRGDEFSNFKDYDTVFLNWNQVRKRIQQLIDDGKYLNPKEQDYLHEYEVKQLARNVYSFQYYTDTEPMMNRSWDVEAGIRQILPILADPEKAKELYDQMFNTWASLRSDFPHYDALRVPLRDMGMYVRGEYSLFQPLPEEVLKADRRISQEQKEARRAASQDDAEVSEDTQTEANGQTVDLNKAARALAKKQKPSANEDQSGQFSLFGGATEGEHTSMFDAAPEEPAPPAPPAPSAPQKAEAEAEKKYSLGYGHLGNGLTVWNNLEYEHGYYKTIAHIEPDRTVKFYDENLPEIIRKQIRTAAATSNYTISATQDAPVFSPSQLVLENGFTTPKGVTYHMGDVLEGGSERDAAASRIEIVGGNSDYVYFKLLLLPTQDPIEMSRREFEDHLDNGRFTIVQEKAATEKVETEVPEEPAPPAPEKKRPGNSRVERNYRNFARQFPEIVSGEYRYLELRSGENSGYMPLIIQSIGGNEIAIAHTYIQNGDIMYDPEMTFRIDPVEGTLEPLTYQQDALGLYQQVYPEPGRWIPRLRKDLSAFADQWLKNIEVQGRARYRAIAVRDGEDVELSFDKDGNPIAEVDSSPPEMDYNTVKEAHPNDLVLYQVGDNFELYGEDAREAARLLKLISRDTQQPVDYSGASSISFSIHAAAEIEVLRTTRDLTICTLDENGRREVRSLPSRAHEGPTQAEPPHPYKVGDTVYVESTEYQIRSIGTSSVDLIQHRPNNPPVIRMENIDTFERLLHLDSRNRDITDFLSDSPNWYDGDLEDVLTGDGGLLANKDKERIAGWFRDGRDNSEIARRMAMTYSNISETMTLATGEVADYFTSYNGLEIEIQDKYNSKETFSWDGIVPFLRAMYEQERGGFFREPVLPEPETTTLADDFEPEAATDGAEIPPPPDETPEATGAGAPEAAASAETPPVEPDLTPNVEQYAVLKAEHPDKLIGVQVGEYMMFYGKDAEEAAQALGTNLLTRDIPGLGETSVTGYRHGWQAALNKLL